MNPVQIMGQRGKFGMRRYTRWDPPKGTPPDVLVRAYLQHLVGCNVRDELESRGMSMADLGRRLGVGGNYLDRKYHGHSWAGLGDVLKLVLELGVHVFPPLEDTAQLQPPLVSSDQAPEDAEN